MGSYLSFAFPAPGGAPEWVYFWFTSSAQYSAYGTNQIYHYATGNWSDAYQTGTKTPAIYGGLSGSSGGSSGGSVGVNSFTVKNHGTSYDLPQTKRSFTLTMGVGEVGRLAISFSYSVQTDILVTTTGDAQLSRLYFADVDAIDKNTGRPLSIIREFDTVGYLTATRVEKGKVYYVFAVCNGGAASGSISFTLDPPAKKWSVGDSAEYAALKASVTRAISLTKGHYSLLKLSFAFAGTARIYTDNTTIDAEMPVMGYLSHTNAVDETYGEVTDCLLHAHGDMKTGIPPNYSMEYEVEADRAYYLVTRNYTASSPMSTTIHILPPPERGPVRLRSGGEMRDAQCFIYSQGAWRSAEPNVYALGAWHIGI